MLRKFVAGQKLVPATIFNELENNNWETAMRLAHTLKGVSGNIGATALQHLAENLEMAIKEQSPREKIDALLELIIAPLESLISQLEQKLPKEKSNAITIVPHEKLQTVFVQLENLLADDDATSTDIWEANSGIFKAAFPDYFVKIDGNIRSFNFDAALVTLRAANGISV